MQAAHRFDTATAALAMLGAVSMRMYHECR